MPALPRVTARLLLRRRWSVLFCICAGWLAGLAAAQFCPPRYRAVARLALASPAPPLASPVVNAVRARIAPFVSPEQLAPILAAHPRFAAAEALSPRRFSARLRRDLRLVPTADPDAPPTFVLSLTAPQPAQAAAVMQSVVARFFPPPPAPDTLSLNPALRQARAQLAERRVRWHAFEAAQAGVAAAAARDRALATGLGVRLSAARALLAQAEQRVALQDRNLATLPPPPPAPPPVVAISPAVAHLRTLEAQLAQLRTRYTDRYPDVEKLAAEIAGLRRSLPTHPPPPPPAKPTPAQLAWRALVAQMRSDRAQAARQVAAQSIRIGSLKAQLAALTQRQRRSQAVAARAAGLQRAVIAAQAGVAAASAPPPASEPPAAAFVLLQAPRLPLRPYFPDPWTFGLAGLLAGVFVGCEWTRWRERYDPCLRTEAAAAQWCAAFLLPGIPPLLTGGERRRRVLLRALEWLAAAVIVVALAAGNFLLYTRR